MKLSIYIGLLSSFLSLNALAANSELDKAHLDLWTLYQETRDADPQILRAKAQTMSGSGRKDEAFGQLLPQLNADSSFNRSRQNSDQSRIEYDGKRYAIGLSQVIYDPQIWRSYQKFTALAAQSEQEYEDAKVQASIDIAERYFSVLAAEDERSLAQRELQATERNLQRAQSLLKRKMAMITDVLELEARVDTLKANEIEAENQIAINREGISELVGRVVNEPLKRLTEVPNFAIPPQKQQYWVDSAQINNPALKARRFGLDAADAALNEAKAGHLPKLELNMSAQRSDIGYEGSLTPRTDNYVASLDFQVPLYSGGSTSARVSALHGDKGVAEQELEALRRQVIRETRTAHYELENGLSRIKAMRQALKSMQTSREATEKAFDYGVKTAVDVLDSIEKEFRARRDLSHAQYKFITNLLVLHRWSGQFGDTDIRRTNAWLTVP